VIQAEVASHDIEFEGRPARLVLAQDVTAREQLEEQLRQSQKMEAVGNLAGGIAHDFNNILMVIRTTVALLERRLTDDALRKDAREIDRAAERAANLTHQLLAFSRRQVLRPETTDLNEIVDDTFELLRRLIGEDITVDCELAPDLASIVVDRSQLSQVILNLAVNARDAMPGGGTLTIRTTRATVDDAYVSSHLDIAAGDYVVLHVTDTGSGMSEETRAHIFDPFFTTKDTGTGLGLATVYGIVNQSGGHIWVYSEPDLGTTFKVYFPAASRQAEPAEESEVVSLHGSETILLVEDEDVLRPLIRQALEEYGYRVLEAAEGHEALAIAEREQGAIALLVTDVVMPRMNGRELADRMVAAYPGLKVLFTSGYPEDTTIRHGVGEGTVEYIEKPYLPEDLAKKVRALLDG
jgi:nitrogen-specific signal transduction histidine kinase/ActR/RegA family two-component response regulator